MMSDTEQAQMILDDIQYNLDKAKRAVELQKDNALFLRRVKTLAQELVDYLNPIDNVDVADEAHAEYEAGLTDDLEQE